MPGKERDAARTRQAVLDAAARTVAAQGAGASLDAIARAAGVSKSGLLHHFRTRDALLLALARDLSEQWTAAVHAAVDPRDHAPGRLVRGYVNATFDLLTDESQTVEHLLLMAALSAVPGVAGLLKEDTQRWAEALEADGLHPDRALLIVRAADGSGLAGLYEGGRDPAREQQTRELLLALSRDDGPFQG